ncbi:hypothetical protein K8Z61_11585 [Nocardioides sp. TRM66260-LWL]|uniref:dCTP deaminase domain-containing protein n=1 Tax=Nocardioides sp. TRM66260-LWL TaxID=2874478 RepID=UPI001CC65308|nr:hypothetical protein [Nocardioides sp. TRM66260-LWL]MBZ5735136.1 hypothetical protein [Nocardioides sp. TRM66260-LWL]
MRRSGRPSQAALLDYRSQADADRFLAAQALEGGTKLAVLQLHQWASFGVRVQDHEDPALDVVGRALTTNERVVLDLHASGDYQFDTKWVKANGKIQLSPGECIRIRTREQVQLSKSVMGMVVSRVSLAADGLNVASIKIDPQFVGRPEIAVMNSSKRTIKLDVGTGFASLVLLRLDEVMTDDLLRVVTPTSSLETPRWKERIRQLAPYAATVAVAWVTTGIPDVINSAIH